MEAAKRIKRADPRKQQRAVQGVAAFADWAAALARRDLKRAAAARRDLERLGYRVESDPAQEVPHEV